jgi:fluoride exporter
LSTYLGLVFAGAVGAPLRYVVDTRIQRARGGVFPLGTLIVNVTGSFLLGVLTGLALYHAFPTAAKDVLGAGFCGAYTTFSTHTFETVRLAEERAHRAALLSVAGNLVLGTAAAALGMAIAAALP